VGHRGAKELAAVGLATSLANVTGYSILTGVAGSLQTITGQAFGARNFTEVSLSLQRCALLCTFIVLLISILWLTASHWLRFLGQDEEVGALAATYLAILLPGVCCYMVTQCLQNWLSAQRVTSPIGTGSAIQAVCYLPFCWLLVYPCGFGFAGAAIATSMGNVFLMSWIVIKARRYVRTQLRDSWQGLSKQAFSQWCSFLRVAIPNFLMISEWWASEITVLLAGTLPNPHICLSTLSLMATTDSIGFMPPLSISVAANTRVSNELGAGRHRSAAHAARVSCILGLIVVFICSMLLLSGRHLWARLFTSDQQVLEHVMPVLSVASLYVVLDGMCVVSSGILKGCRRQAVLAPIVIASYYLVGLPLSWFLAWPANLGTIGLAWGSTAGTGTHCLCFAALVLSTRWPQQAERVQALVQVKQGSNAASQCLTEDKEDAIGGA